MSESEGRRDLESISTHHHGRDVAHGNWSSAPATPTFAGGFDLEDDHEHHHVKKSVLAKVREKARKWTHILAKKKHGHDDDNPTPPWGVTLDEEDDEQDPEYHGAPMYESETAPDTYREGSSKHRPASQRPEKSVVFQHDKGSKEPEMKQEGNDMLEQPVLHLHHLDAIKETSSPHATSSSRDMPAHQDPVGESGTNKTLTETVTEMLTPAYTMVSDATQMIASRIQSPGRGYELGAKQMWDKGISVKEYLMHKLEPGEEDRALCQVITEAVSPRNAGQAQGEVGVVDKVKEAVSSLLGREEVSPTETETTIPVCTNPPAHRTPIQVPTNIPCTREAPTPLSTYLHAHGSSIPVSTNLNAHKSPILDSRNLQEHGSPIPVSTNPYAEEVEIDERRLQAYTN